MQFLKNFIKWVTTPTSTAMQPLTEGKTRGNIKPYPRKSRPSSPSPAMPPPSILPKIMTKCEWIEVHTGAHVKHHHNAKFRVEPNGHLTVDEDGITVVYRDYSKYITRG